MPDVLLSPNQKQCQRTEEHTKHLPQLMACPHPFFTHHQTSDRKGVAPLMQALGCQKINSQRCTNFKKIMKIYRTQTQGLQQSNIRSTKLTLTI